MSENKHTMSDLYSMQAAPLSVKIKMTARRIRDWVDEFGQDGVYVSFSGGKDSTVLVDIVRNVCGYKEIPLVFVDVPTQYPELKEFEKLFLQEKLETKSIEEQTKEITMKFEKEKQKVKVNSLTEEIEKLKEKKVTNQKELNDYRDLIEQYKVAPNWSTAFNNNKITFAAITNVE